MKDSLAISVYVCSLRAGSIRKGSLVTSPAVAIWYVVFWRHTRHWETPLLQRCCYSNLFDGSVMRHILNSKPLRLRCDCILIRFAYSPNATLKLKCLVFSFGHTSHTFSHHSCSTCVCLCLSNLPTGQRGRLCSVIWTLFAPWLLVRRSLRTFCWPEIRSSRSAASLTIPG